jgi:hypothetical protein
MSKSYHNTRIISALNGYGQIVSESTSLWPSGIYMRMTNDMQFSKPGSPVITAASDSTRTIFLPPWFEEDLFQLQLDERPTMSLRDRVADCLENFVKPEKVRTATRFTLLHWMLARQDAAQRQAAAEGVVGQ